MEEEHRKKAQRETGTRPQEGQDTSKVLNTSTCGTYNNDVNFPPSQRWPIFVLGMRTDEGLVCLGCHSWCYVTLLARSEFLRPRGNECSSLCW